jgi:hypothetical protein
VDHRRLVDVLRLERLHGAVCRQTIGRLGRRPGVVVDDENARRTSGSVKPDRSAVTAIQQAVSRYDGADTCT